MSTARSKSRSTGRTPGIVKPVLPATAEPDARAAQKLVLALMAIPGRSGEEGLVRQFIIDQLRAAGAPASAIRGDQAHRHTPLKGEVGNLVLRLPGTIRGPRRLLMAHMDTVPLCAGAKPVVKGERVYSAVKQTGLGADDRAGCAVILTAATEILRRKLPHPPLAFMWAVQEEVGLFGARHANLALLGQPKLAFNWDGGSAEKLTVGATGAYRLEITIDGIASHAGGAPEQGVSAIAIAGLAIAELQRGGWLGDVRKGNNRGTSNIGVIHGGAATNVVTDRVDLKAEARSHDPVFRRAIRDAIIDAFKKAAGEVRSVTGAAGKATCEHRQDYESFRLPEGDPSIAAAATAVAATGGKPFHFVSNGGLDANWLTARGIPTVTLGCGQLNAHMVTGQLDLAEFRRACRIALRLATASE
ncbi:MAG TPA: M20/M25/M40 family metallo-hydrolase [Pirellulales bacterium]|jgi:tripeptide aminopeptidase